MPVPIATVGIPASINGFPPPPGVIALGSPTVYANGLPVAYVGSLITIHGNPYNPKAPGYNPICAAALIAQGIPNVLVEWRPAAMLGAPCTCGQHFVTVGSPNVYIGP